MNARQFKRFLEAVTQLTAGQLEQVRSALATEHTERAGYQAIEAACPCACRRCGSEKMVRNGVQNGLQRFLCRDCGKTSTLRPGRRSRGCATRNASTRTRMKNGLREATDEVGLKLDWEFRWRHRFLSEVVAHQPKGISGILGSAG